MKNLRKILMALLICVMIVSVFVACNDTPAESPDNIPSGGTPAETPSGTPDETDPSHTHVFGAEWKADGENHWHECECGEKKDVTAHVFSEEMEVAGNIIVYTCTVCEKDIAVPYDPTEAVSYYWAPSIYDEDLIARYCINKGGKIVAIRHYLVCNETEYTFGALYEEMRDVFVYDKSGKLQFVEVYEDYSGAQLGVYGAYEKLSMSAKYGFTYTADGKMDKVLWYDGDNEKPDEGTLMQCVYGNGGALERLDVYEGDEVYLSFFIENGKIVKMTDGGDGDGAEIIYNSDGNVISTKKNELIQNMAYEYNEMGYPSKITFDVGGEDESSVIYTYNADGTVKETQMTNDSTCRAEFFYDAEGRQTEVKIYDTVDGKELFLWHAKVSYDANGMMASYEYVSYNPQAPEKWRRSTIAIERDGEGRITSVEMADYESGSDVAVSKTRIDMKYNEAGDLLSQEMVEYAYDTEKKEYCKTTENTVIRAYDSEGREVTYSQIVQRYDRDGKVLYAYKNETSTAYNENGKAVTNVSYMYDAESNTFIENYKFVTEYDKDGNEIRREEINGNRRVVYEYQPDRNGEYYCKTVTHYYKNILSYREEYNEYGDTVNRTHWDDNGQIAEVWETKFTYDDKERPATSDEYNNGIRIESCVYGYDADGDRYVAKRTSYYSDGKVREEIEYNDHGDIILALCYENDGALMSKSTYSYVYDDNGYIAHEKREDFDVTTGKVIFTCELEYALDENGGRYVKKETERDYDDTVTIREYNTEGKTISLTVKDKNGNVIQSQNVEYTYDEMGRIVSSKAYSNGKLVEECFYTLNDWNESYKYQAVEYHEDGSKTVISYDKWEYELGRVEYDKNGNVVSRSGKEYLYNDAGEAIGERRYESNRLVYECEYGTDKDGYRYDAKEIYYYEDGGKNVIEYDECGNQTRNAEYDSAGNVTWERESVHTYDENGRRIYEKEYVDGRLTAEYEYEYIADHGNTITRKEIHYYEDGGKEITYNDDRGHAEKNVIYDANGNVTEENTYVSEYDSHGCITLQKAYKNGKLVSVAEVYSCEEAGYGEIIKRWTGYNEDGSKYIYEYNVYGECVKETYYDENGNLIKEYTYSYEYDRERNIILELIYMDGELIAEEHRYSIDDGISCVGTIKKWIEYFDDGSYRVTDYNMYGEQTSVVVYDKNGNVIG